MPSQPDVDRGYPKTHLQGIDMDGDPSPFEIYQVGKQPSNWVMARPAAFGLVVAIEGGDDRVHVVDRRVSVCLPVVFEIHCGPREDARSVGCAGDLRRRTLCRRVFDRAIVDATPRRARHGMMLRRVSASTQAGKPLRTSSRDFHSCIRASPWPEAV